MNILLTAKLRCRSVERLDAGPGQVVENLKLSAVPGDSAENAEWSRWTPTAELSLSISREAVQGRLSPGKDYLITIQEVPA
jgi:hypothetical protein